MRSYGIHGNLGRRANSNGEQFFGPSQSFSVINRVIKEIVIEVSWEKY